MLHGARIIDLDHLKGELQKCQCCLKVATRFDNSTLHKYVKSNIDLKNLCALTIHILQDFFLDNYTKNQEHFCAKQLKTVTACTSRTS